MEIYVDDMSTVASSIILDEGFDHTNYSNNSNMGFFSANNDGTAKSFKNINVGLFEFNTSVYTQTQREELKARRPEI
jgi:hypothetical protein